ncbi:DUF692 family multinuclear iron-containing protein [Larkinella sp. C7]|jgi:uncharacterized protein (UPF0276 family)|uniref:multinuclear nonheme iron-dependent oxidase n=1 Tax=Larkinella sp. C7 TaxID=2576607 RepID=UPI001111597B|nr:DUF692 family multinuclear iron-containing protein [Larkinella sp. C7]
MANLHSALACNLDANILQASLPLLEAEQVDAIEWAFDTLYRTNKLPDWFDQLLRIYSDAGRLVGHGVFFSLFSGHWTADQQAWLKHLKILSSHYRFDHVTEHFGFMTGADFHTGAPLSVPLNSSTLSIGKDRLKRIQEAARCPVGLENLAFAYSLDDVKRQGDFLHQLIYPVNGFLILDLHNLYCQSHNFRLGYEQLLRLYPLDRVREIHLSGGSWEPATSEPGRTVRRDTHDEAVPTELFGWLEKAIDQCPNLKYVVLEQVGSGLRTEQARQGFARDFRQMKAIVKGKSNGLPSKLNTFLPGEPIVINELPVEDAELFAQQRQLATILESANDYQHARQLLASSNLAGSDWLAEKWQPGMLETAIAIAQKWRKGFS